MKKIVLGLVAIVMMLGIATTNVNAANLTADKTEANKGDEVTVTVNLDEESRNIDIKLNYDATKFEYVAGSASSSLGTLTVNDKTAGKIIVSGSNPTESTKAVSFKFKALETTEGSEFTGSGLVTEKNEELTGASVSVKVTEKAEEKPAEEKPAEEPKKEETPATDTKKDTSGNTITKLPKTGVSYITIAGVVAVVIAAIIVVKKVKNN